MIEEQYNELANAIVLQAVEDYREALWLRDTRTISECERFFKSKWFIFLTNVKGEFLIEKLRAELKEENYYYQKRRLPWRHF